MSEATKATLPVADAMMGEDRMEAAAVSSEHAEHPPSDHVSTEELARRQGIRPIGSVEELGRPGVVTDEELAEFHRFVAALRHDVPA